MRALLNRLHSSSSFDAKAISRKLHFSRVQTVSAWRDRLSNYSADEQYFIQKEYLQAWGADGFVDWFGLNTLLRHIGDDPLLPTIHNPSIWSYVFEHTPIAQRLQVLHSYWGAVLLLRPRECIEPSVLDAIHRAVQNTVDALPRETWLACLNPGVLSYPEEQLFSPLSLAETMSTLGRHTAQTLDVSVLRQVPLSFPILRTLVWLMGRLQCTNQWQLDLSPQSWPSFEHSYWDDDLHLSLYCAMQHSHFRHWWRFPQNIPEMPSHLDEAISLINLSIELYHPVSIHDWIENHTH